MPDYEAGDNFYVQEGSEDSCLGKYLFGMCTNLLQDPQNLHLRTPECLGYNIKNHNNNKRKEGFILVHRAQSIMVGMSC